MIVQDWLRGVKAGLNKAQGRRRSSRQGAAVTSAHVEACEQRMLLSGTNDDTFGREAEVTISGSNTNTNAAAYYTTGFGRVDPADVNIPPFRAHVIDFQAVRNINLPGVGGNTTRVVVNETVPRFQSGQSVPFPGYREVFRVENLPNNWRGRWFRPESSGAIQEEGVKQGQIGRDFEIDTYETSQITLVLFNGSGQQVHTVQFRRLLTSDLQGTPVGGGQTLDAGQSRAFSLQLRNTGNLPYQNGGSARYEVRNQSDQVVQSGAVALPVVPEGQMRTVSTPSLPFGAAGSFTLHWEIDTGEQPDWAIDAGNGQGSGASVLERDSFANQNFPTVVNNCQIADVSITVRQDDLPPVLNIPQQIVNVNEGSIATNSGTFFDREGPALMTSIPGLTTSGNTWNWSRRFDDGGVSGIRIDLRVTDNIGQPTSGFFLVNVLNVPPTAFIDSVSAPRQEGAAVRINGSATDPAGAFDTLTYTYEVFRQEESLPLLSQSGVDLAGIDFLPADNGVFEVVLTVRDEDGGTSTPVRATFEVSNVAPQIADLAITSPIAENEQAVLTGSIVDPGADSFTLVIDWKDGSPAETISLPVGTTSFAVPHRYLDDGSSPGNGTPADEYDVQVSLQDDDGGTASGQISVTVQNVAPVITGSSQLAVPQFSVPQFIAQGTNDILGFDAADLDGDGDVDVATVSRLDNRVVAWMNDGSGSFTPNFLQPLDDGIEIKAGDIDGDGDVDLVATAVDGRQVRLYENDGSQNYSVSVIAGGVRGNQLELVDTDADGDLDVVFGSQDGGLFVAENLGSAGFGLQTLLTGLGVVRDVQAGDINDDGVVDLLVASRANGGVSAGGVNLLTGDGSGGYVTQQLVATAGAVFAGAAFADIDHDGDQDLLATDETNDLLYLYTNTSTGLVESSLPAGTDGPNAVHPVDVDGNGTLDLLIAGVNSDSVAYLRNDGSGSFETFAAAAGIDGARNVLTADITGDGRPEILVDARFGDGVMSFEYLGERLTALPTIAEGQTTTLSVDFIDPGSLDVHSATIDWGDGTVETVSVIGRTVTASHQYTDDSGAGVFPIRLTLTDDDGGEVTAVTEIRVTNVGPVIDLGEDCLIHEGDDVLLDLTQVTDPGDDTISAVIVDWGDGSIETFTSLATVSHTYADGPAEHTISVTLIDEDGQWTSADVSTAAYLSNVSALSASLLARYELDGNVDDSVAAADGITQGSPTFEPGLVGDSIVTSNGNYGWVQPGTGFVPGTNTYSASLHFKLDALSSPVGFAPLLITQQGDFSEGSFFAVGSTNQPGDTLLIFLDGGGDGVTVRQTVDFVLPESLFGDWHHAGYSIDRVNETVSLYLDGVNVGSQPLTVGSIDSTKGLFIGQYDFEFARNGNPRFVGGNDLQLDDVLLFNEALTDVQFGGLSLVGGESFTKQVTVNNVAPVVASVNSPVIDENGIATISGSFSDVGTLDTHTVDVDWGDGSVTAATVDPVSRTFTASYQYLDDDPTATPSDVYTVSVTVTDDDTGVGTAATTVTVNNVAPVVASVNSPVIDENGIATISGSFRDVGTLDTHTVDIDWGDGSVTAATVDPSSRTFTASYQYLDDDPTATPSDVYNVSVTVTDDDTGVGTAATTVTVNNVAPVVASVNSPVIDENGIATISGSFSDVGTLDTHTVDVDWGDGSVTAATVDPVSRTFTASYQYLDDDPTATPSDVYTVSVTVTDDDTGVGTAATTVTVNNVAPVVASVNSPVIDENGIATISGSFSDVGTLDTHTVDVDWGDGSVTAATVDPSSRTFTASYQYLDDDPTATSSDVYNVSVTVTDDDTGVGTAATTVTVNNVAPVVASVNSPVIDENGIATISGSFRDVGTLDTHTVDVDWGDGSVTAATVDPSSRTFTASYQYLDDDPTATPSDVYNVSVTVTDDDTGVDTAATTVTVNNVAPTLAVASSHDEFCDAASDGVVTIDGSFADIGSLDTHSATIDWGDGTPVESVSGIDQLQDVFQAAHTYASGGVYPVTVTLTDDDGGQVQQVTTAVVRGTGVVGDVLYVIGSNGKDRLNVRQSHGRIRVDLAINGQWQGRRHGRYVYEDYVWQSFDVSEVSSIVVHACDGSDLVDVWVNDHTPVFVDAGAGHDSVWTAGANDTVLGGAGNDMIRTFGGDDFVDAGEGNNKVWSGRGHDTVVAGAGDDWIGTDGGDDTIDAGDGTNDVQAGSGNDVIVTGAGHDWIDAGAGDDEVSSGAGSDVIYAGAGNDVVDSGDGHDCVHGGDGADRLSTGEGSDWVDGGDGADVILAGAGNDEIDAGDGHDVVVAGAGHDVVNGGRGRDVLIGGTGRDRISGGRGEDLLIAGTTAFDDDDAALTAIFQEWTSHASYLDRVENLRTGSGSALNGIALTEQTVSDDGERDQLWGGQGRDYFLAGHTDRVADRKRREHLDLFAG